MRNSYSVLPQHHAQKRDGEKSEGKDAPQFDEQRETDYLGELLSIIC